MKEDKLVLNKSVGKSIGLPVVPKAVVEAAEAAARAVEVEVAGIDLVQDSRDGKVYIVEVNEAPEFKVIGEGPSTFYARISLTPARSKDVKRKKLEELILSKKEITTTEVMNKLKVSRVTAIDLMKTFVNQGILEHQGSTRSSRYISKLFNQNVH